MRARFTRSLFYLWAAPATFVGLCLAGVACALGASARVRRGVLEVAGGRLTPAAGAASGPLPFLAITFGHVVLGLSHEILEAERAHEHAHVRQYERWGLLFIPLYLGSSAAQLAAGRHPYWHNVFEKQAFAAAAAPKEQGPPALSFHAEAPMPAYVLVQVDVHDAAGYERYRGMVLPSITAHGGRFLVRGGPIVTLEGTWHPPRLVILEFPDAARARAWWASPEYAEPKALRLATARSEMILVEGV